MEHEELINTIMKNMAENRVESLQLPKKPKKLKLDKAKPKPKASTKKLAPSLSIMMAWEPVTTVILPPSPPRPRQSGAPPAAQGARTAQAGRG